MNESLNYKVFESAWDSWDSLFKQASEFADSIGRENVLNISHSCDGNNRGVVTVWYWKRAGAAQRFGINQINFGE